MVNKFVERAEYVVEIGFALFETMERLGEKQREMMDKKIELETGFNKEFTLIWLKGKFVMMLPEEWRMTAIRLMTDY